MDLRRLQKALAKDGLRVERDGSFWRLHLTSRPDIPPTEVLLPDDLPLEAKALRQLANLASASHPSGGRIVRVFASPDFHPGDSGVAIGSVVETEGMVIPLAVGDDINCGMRLHTIENLALDEFIAKKPALIDGLKKVFFSGSRDIVLSGEATREMFGGGLRGLLRSQNRSPTGIFKKVDLDRLQVDLNSVYEYGSFHGDPRWVPADRYSASSIRDPELGTIGGGNHFLEFLQVDAIEDGALAWAYGVKKRQIAFMIHSGSRMIGKAVGKRWAEKAREEWPPGVPYPVGNVFSLSEARSPLLVDNYLEAEATAANYGFANRMILSELVKLQVEDVFGSRLMPLVYDSPHNVTLQEGTSWVARKGACPAYLNQPVVVPGSMGAASYLLAGKGKVRSLRSASHGAGRAKSRLDMHRMDESLLGLSGVECVAIREDRKIEEAPAGYKDVASVVQSQVDQGIVDVVAKLRPLLTFKC